MMDDLENRLTKLEAQIEMMMVNAAESWMPGPQLVTSQILSSGGGCQTWKSGRFAIDDEWKIVNKYVTIGDSIYEVNGEYDVEEGVMCVRISADKDATEDSIDIVTFDSVSAVIRASKDDEWSYLMLYEIEGSEDERKVKCDFRIGPGSTMWDFRDNEES